MGGNLKEIRKKIVSVQNTQKTTRAMKLVSTSKLKKAEGMARQSRFYAKKLNEVFEDLVKKISIRGLDSVNSAFFTRSKNRKVRVVDLVVITSDKGLCGGFNMSTIKEALRIRSSYIASGVNVRIRAVGKKGIAYFRFNKIDLVDEAPGLSSLPDYQNAAKFVESAVEDFLKNQTDEVIILYNGFKNMLTQELRTQTILPLHLGDDFLSNDSHGLYVEPDEEEDRILDELAKRFFEYNMYYALIDSLAAEHSARMQAMDVATNNAGDLVRSLIVSYNNARQEAITTELVEINAGVEAMK